MPEDFNYAAPAELYSGGRRGSRAGKHIRYWRFATAAEALQYAIETLPAENLPGAMLEVGDERFGSDRIVELYQGGDYPLPRPD